MEEKQIYADPTYDTAFKRILGSEKFKSVTIDVLNSFIEDRHITDVKFINPELLPESKQSRKAIVDVICTDESCAHFIVEMQRAKQANFLQRSYFYTSKVAATLEGPIGDWEFDINPTYMLSFLYFKMDYLVKDERLKGRTILKYSIREEESNVKMNPSSEMYFVDVHSFDKNLENITDIKEIWIYLFKNSKYLSMIPEKLKSHKPFMDYFEACALANFTPEQQLAYFNEQMAEWDNYNIQKYAIKESREQGREEASLESARKLKALGVSAEIISSATGLSLEKIAEL